MIADGPAYPRKRVKNSVKFLEKCKAHLHEHYTFQKAYKPITLCKASYNYTFFLKWAQVFTRMYRVIGIALRLFLNYCAQLKLEAWPSIP
jgi:hypothetical protein